jgi:hypothetical protein
MNEYFALPPMLESLHYCIAALEYSLENWVSPRLAVGPGPRLKLSEAAEQQARERLKLCSDELRPTTSRN